MSKKVYRVGIVVDKDFGERLVSLSRSLHLWVIESRVNRPFIDQVVKLDNHLVTYRIGVSCWPPVSEEESSEDSCIWILPLVDEFHSERYELEAPWSEIEVFGAELTAVLMSAFREFGCTEFESTLGGFRATREVADHHR